MVGTLGQPPRNGDFGPGCLVALGLVVSMVSFAGFRLTTDTKPQQPTFASGDNEVVTASVPTPPIPSILLPRLTAADPENSLTRTSPIPSGDPSPAGQDVSSLLVPPPLDLPTSLADVP